MCRNNSRRAWTKISKHLITKRPVVTQDVTNIQLNSTLLVTYVEVLFWMMLKAFSLFFFYIDSLYFFSLFFNLNLLTLIGG